MPGAQHIYDEEGRVIGGESEALNVEGSVTVSEVGKATEGYTDQIEITQGTRSPLAASETLLKIGRVEITSMDTNNPDALVFVGFDNVTPTNGHVLTVDKTTVVFIDDLAKVYVQTTITGSKVSFLAT